MRRLKFLAILLLLAVLVAGAGSGTAVAEQLKFRADLSGANEVPPRPTEGDGKFKAWLVEDGAALQYTLELKDLSNTVAAHIHIGDPTVNGPVVAFLYGAVPAGGGFEHKIKVSGVITADDLVGPLAGMPLSALIDQMVAGNTYVNAHTNDGDDTPNEGPGDFPGGEIRGQVRVQ